MLYVAHGAGANIIHIGSQFPDLTSIGVYIAHALFPAGLRLMKAQGVVTPQYLIQADAYELNHVL